jgi:DNA-binding transcriptional regulator YdaS (Cro superfamily)
MTKYHISPALRKQWGKGAKPKPRTRALTLSRSARINRAMWRLREWLRLRKQKKEMNAPVGD